MTQKAGQMTPTIVSVPRRAFAGLRIPIRSSLSEPNDLRGVPALWQELGPLAAKLSSRVGSERYVVIVGDLPDRKEPVAYYYGLVAVQDNRDLPHPLIPFELPAGKMVRVIHKGSPAAIGDTAGKLLHEWLPHSGEVLAHNLELMVMAATYDRNSPEAEMEYSLFIL